MENWKLIPTESVSIWGPLTGIKIKELNDEGKSPFAKASCKVYSSKAIIFELKDMDGNCNV